MALKPRHNLGAFIEASGKTLTDLAAETGVSRQTIAKWIKGEGGNNIRTRRLQYEFAVKIGADPQKVFPGIGIGRAD